MIASIQKAIKILMVIADSATSPTPLWRIAERTGINKSTCSRMIETLLHEGFLVKISASRGYILGPAAYCLSRFGRYGSDLISTCRPVMQYLYNTLGHCVVLAVIEGSTKYVIDYIDDGRIFEQKQKIRKDDIYRTATGRAILRNMTDGELETIWQKYGKPTDVEWAEIGSLDDLLRYRDHANGDEVLSTRTAIANGSVSIGYAAPIFRNMRCVGAIGVAVKLATDEEKTFAAKEEKHIKYLLAKGASVISARL